MKWSQGHSSENKRPVDVSPHRYQHCCDDRSMVLPGGWSRRENGDSTDGFFHEGFPTAKLNYPLPLPATDQTIETLPPTRFLFSRTRIGYFVSYSAPTWKTHGLIIKRNGFPCETKLAQLSIGSVKKSWRLFLTKPPSFGTRNYFGTACNYSC